MFGKAVILATFLAWLYTHHEGAKQAFLLSLVAGTIRLAIIWTLHRRKWAKYVFHSSKV
jgi:uncharacterized membrane protein